MCKTLTRDNFCATQNDHLSFAFSFSFSQVRELVTGSENCPYDWVRLYDGVDEYSPLIGHFCGIGSFPRFMMILIGLIQSCHKVIVNLLQVNNRNFKQALPRVYIIPCRTPLKHWLWLQVNIRSSLYKQCIHQTHIPWNCWSQGNQRSRHWEKRSEWILPPSLYFTFWKITFTHVSNGDLYHNDYVL